MKILKTCNFIATGIILIFCTCLYGQKPDMSGDEKAIRITVLDYIEGFYSGDPSRLEKALSPELHKLTPRTNRVNGRTTIVYTSYSTLLENASNRVGVLPDSTRKIQMEILSIEQSLANIKLISSQFTELIQLAKMKGEWKICQIIFTSGVDVNPRLNDFNAEKEKNEVLQTSLYYLNGISSANAALLELSLDCDFNRFTLLPAGNNATNLRRQGYTTLYENAMANIGKQDEVYRNNQVEVLDITDGIASVKCDFVSVTEYVQLYKGNEGWKIIQSFLNPNNKLTLKDAMTATIGNPMPEFTLPVFQGGEFSLATQRGKNVLLLFPRGNVGNGWCAICGYQYLEWEKMMRDAGIEKKYNVKIAFVMPYKKELITDWLEKFPQAIQTVEGLKNPQPVPAEGSLQADYAVWARKTMPLVFTPGAKDPHNLLPILVDEQRTLSRQLKLFTNFWDNISAEQNIASVFIVDKNGILRFKYIGQMTEDRPSAEFLLGILKDLK